VAPADASSCTHGGQHHGLENKCGTAIAIENVLGGPTPVYIVKEPL